MDVQLTVLGTSPSFPNPGKACSGYLARAGETDVLVDCGHGVASALFSLMDPRGLAGIVISHMHADHFLDLVPLHYGFLFRYPQERPLPVWLPPEGQKVFDRVMEALGLQAESLAKVYLVGEYDRARTLSVGDIEIDFAPTRHFVSGYAMRISGPGKGSLIYTSDTGVDQGVTNFMHGTPLAFVEATELEYAHPSGANGHLTGRLAGEMAAQAGVEQLVLIHYPESIGEQIAAQASAAFGKSVELARQGQTYGV